jgi:predicted phage gp36 major capsid-like protein
LGPLPGQTALTALHFGTNHRPTGQRGFYMHFRVGADCLIPDAFRLTNHSA